ncbi:MAG: hypothetical protein M3Q07_09465, partial [Pseudobdellovibrionaceae bacterium]|nr:hypothetical protein [Pseudobdellovibrionaceae bacterium]
LWLAFGNQPENLMILRGEGGDLQRMKRPDLMPWKDIISRDFLVTPRGQVLLGPNIWDNRTQAWQPIHELAEMGFQQHMTPDFTDQGELYWTTGQGLIQSGAEGLRYWDFSMLGLQKIGASSKPVFEQQGLWVAAKEHGGLEYPYYVNVSPWLLFRRPAGFADGVISNFWLTNGQPRIYVPNDGLYQQEATGWAKLMASPQFGEKQLLSQEQFEGYAIEPQGLHRLDPDALQWQRIHTFTKYSNFKGGLKDQQGRIWIYEPNRNQAGFIKANTTSLTSVVPGVNSVHLHGLYSLQNSIHTSSSEQLLRYDEATGGWVSERRWSEDGFVGPNNVVQADAETLVVHDRFQQGKPEGMWLFKPASSEKTFLPIQTRGMILGHAVKNARGDFIITVDYDIHLVESGTGRIRHLFNKTDLKNLFKEEDKEVEYISLIVDAENRLWININKGLLMIHLP